MFKRPSAQDTDNFTRNRLLQKQSQTNNQNGPAIQAVPIKRTDFRRIDPSLAAPIVEKPLPTTASSEVILQGKELQDYLEKQKKMRAAAQKAEALQKIVDNHETTDSQAQQVQELMQDQIVASAALALSRLPAQKRQLVVDLINQLREN